MNRRVLSPSELQPRYLALCCLTLAAFYLFFASSLLWAWIPEGCGAPSAPSHLDVLAAKHPSPSSDERVLEHSGPKPSFRENLRNDTYYITSWATAGMTNEFIGFMNLIYLGFITERVPIVSPFLPHEHMPWGAGPLAFSAAFNLDGVRNHLRRPILEWSDVKELPVFDYSSSDYDKTYQNSNVESIGCWSTRGRHDPRPAFTRLTERLLGLDVSYTRVPDYAWLRPDVINLPFVKLHSLLAMTMPGHPREPSGTYPILAASPSNGTLPPDEHISCYDDLFYATTEVDELDWRFTWSPSWRTVGTHLRFSDQLLDLSQSYLRKALGLAEQEAIPPIITVHIRHGDFIHQCEAHDRLCLVGPGNFAKAVESIQRRLLDERGLEVSRVFVASDEEDPEFWRDIDERGWAHINHTAEGTSERFNAWYPPLIDTAILSFGMGFVGTASSSFSTLAAWRVMDWNKGITTLVARDG